MTDPETADITYIEPLNVERLEQIIAKERPDALLPNLGGQSGLNLCSELYKAGVLDKYNVKVIGVQVDAIERGEDRIEFKKTMNSLGIEMARSEVAYSVDEALAIADRLGYPVVLRPAYTMGGAGGGLVYNREELQTVCARGLQASIVGQVLVEESILGWEELELEVVRDSEGNMITVCFIENIDPLGVHTGDSFCCAPMLTISEDCQKRLQEQAYKIVDKVQVIGGTNVQFAHDPGAKGYSAANLWRMRNFYLTYRDSKKLAPLVREISWSNNIIIMEKCKDDLQREFYIQMTKRYGWTKRILTNFIEAQTYEKYLLNQTNFDLTLPVEQRVQAKLAVKDEYTFDFAELSPEYSEHELEMQLVNNIRAFLIEMGGDYTFIGNQYHLMAGNRDLYIDLLLFHRRLRSLIAIELKIGEFEAEYAGKMQLYLTALDEQVKLPDENPSIGIIICKNKDKTYVEYALKNINAPIGVATYQLRNTLPEEMKAMLPEPEEIVKRLRIFEE